MSGRVQEMSRQVFELDDDRVRIFCRPQFIRPPPPGQGGGHPQRPNGPGVCCQPGGGGVNPTPFPSSTTTTEDYDTYTGTGTGSYTGEDENGNDYDYGRLQNPTKKSQKMVVQRRNNTTITPQRKREKLRMSEATTGRNTTNANRTMDVTTTNTTRTGIAKAGVVNADKGHKRAIRSLRHKDVIVSFADWQRKHSAERHQF